MLFFRSTLSSALRHVSCGKLIAEGEFVHPDRTIDTHLLLVGVKNTLHFQEGADRLDLGQDEALFLRPGIHQCSYAPSRDLVYYWTHFHMGEDLELISEQQAIESYHLMNTHVYGERIVLIPRHTHLLFPSRISLLFQQLFFSRYGNCYTQQYANYCLGMLLIEITQQAMEHYHAEFPAANQGLKFSEIVQWININIDKPLSAAKIAEMFGYTPSYLSELFKSKTGYPLMRYINRLRIEKAKSKLLGGSDSLTQIARDVGFTDTKYFLRTFKQYMGVSPTRLKNAWTATHLNNR